MDYMPLLPHFPKQTPSKANVPIAIAPAQSDIQYQRQSKASKYSEKDDKKEKGKRLGQACVACRKRKVKCSGDKPVCANCLRSNSPCVYTPSVKGKAPRSGYNEMLQKRLDKMEQLLQPLKEGPSGGIWKSSSDVPEPETDPLGDSETYTSPAVTHGTKRTAYGEEKDSVGTIAEEDDFAKPKTQTGLPRVASEARADSADDEDQFKSSIPLPLQYIREHLAETYFANCSVPYTVLHKPTFMKQLAEETAPHALVLAVCAVSARFSQHPDVRQYPMSTAGDEYAARARQLLAYEFDRPTLSNIQAFLILALHEFGSSRGRRAWMYSGIAIRMAINLALNVEDEQGLTNRPWIESEIRRRVFWSSFIMDRFSSSSSVHAPHFLREKDVQIQLPCSEYEFMNAIPAATEMLDGKYHPAVLKIPGIQYGQLDPCAYFIRMISTWGQVVSYVNGPRHQTLPPWDPKSDFANFNQELYRMHSSLPPHYVYTQSNLFAAIAENRSHSLIFLHITIRHSLYFLHRWIFPNKADPQTMTVFKRAPDGFIKLSARKCIASANAISRILADVLEMNTLLLVPFIGFCAFTTAMLHVCNAFSPDPEISSTAKRHLATNLKILMIMQKHWTVTKGWCQAVRELYELQQNSAGDRKGSFAQNMNSAITYGSMKDYVPNKYDKQFLHSGTAPLSQPSGSPTQTSSVTTGQGTSQSPVGMFTDVWQTVQTTPQSTYPMEEPTIPALLYPPAAEISPEALRQQAEERALLEAMTQSASLPDSPYLGATGWGSWGNVPYDIRDPQDEALMQGIQAPLGWFHMNPGDHGGGSGPLENRDFGNLGDIINSMEGGGMDVGGGGLEGGFGFLEGLNLFDPTGQM